MCVRSFITVKKDRECFWRRHQKGDRVSSLVIMTQCKERLWRLNQLTALSFTNLNCNDLKRNSGTSNSPNQSPNTKFMLPGWYGCLVLQHMKNFTDLNTSILRLILLHLHTQRHVICFCLHINHYQNYTTDPRYFYCVTFMTNKSYI